MIKKSMTSAMIEKRWMHASMLAQALPTPSIDEISDIDEVICQFDNIKNYNIDQTAAIEIHEDHSIALHVDRVSYVILGDQAYADSRDANVALARRLADMPHLPGRYLALMLVADGQPTKILYCRVDMRAAWFDDFVAGRPVNYSWSCFMAQAETAQ